MYISFSDIASVAVFLIITVLIADRVEAVTRDVDGSNIKASDYSVLVRGLPKDVTEAEILQHFHGLYDLGKPDWTYNGYACFLGRKTNKRPQEKTRAREAGKVRLI